MIYNIIIIITFIIFLIISIEYKINKEIKNNTYIEIIWTIIPILILLSIGISGIKILLNDIYTPYLTIEIKGNQWFWTYSFKDFNYTFDSYYLDSNSSLKYLLVDKPLYLPCNLPIRFLITSEDVIHSFTIPSLGFKLDSNPGRINTLITNILYPGNYYGQCSELCGTLHSKMPIHIKIIKIEKYIEWIINKKINNILYKNYYNLIG